MIDKDGNETKTIYEAHLLEQLNSAKRTLKCIAENTDWKDHHRRASECLKKLDE